MATPAAHCRIGFRHLAATCLLIGSLAVATAALAAEPRTALVVGNGAYSYARLRNPVNDAGDVAAALRGAGFDVILKTDADQRTMKEAIRSFGDTLKSRIGGVGLFYFAGHGVQVSGENYIIPIGERFADNAELTAQSVAAAEVVDAMTGARNELNIVVLDACRDNPLASATGVRGLSRIDSGPRLFVSFSTSPGGVARDGWGRNSPYTKHLAQAINTPNLSLEETFKRTLKGVYRETRGQQTPWLSSSFFGDFVFRSGAEQSGGAPPKAIAAPPLLPGLYRLTGTNPNHSFYYGMAAIAAQDDKLRFTWWMGREVFTGVGQFAGRMVVVNFGARHPVVYTIEPDGILGGEWADGSATDQLELFAKVVPGTLPAPEGRYKTSGRNPNGTGYTGTVSIARRSDRFEFEWQVGARTYRGTGTLDGNLLTVDWGSEQPVVYALSQDGGLRGLWADGRGEDVLTPDR